MALITGKNVHGRGDVVTYLVYLPMLYIVFIIVIQ